MTEKEQAVIDFILQYGMEDGAHHKQWVLDQTLRLLLGERYKSYMRKIDLDRVENDYGKWDEGIAP